MIQVAVSACVLGQPVRYDATDRRHRALAVLSERFELVPICPEVEIGLGVPRPPVRLLGDGRVLHSVTGRDLTGDLEALAVCRAEQLSGVCGAVFKHKSPSCGLTGVKVFAAYTDGAHIATGGRGAFAARWRQLLPDLPVIEEHELATDSDIEAFAERVDAFSRERRTA